jgi:predicted MFS family arabinose efflux permease
MLSVKSIINQHKNLCNIKGGCKMIEKSPKFKNIILILVLGLLTMTQMGDMVIIPVAEHLFEDFSGVSMGILNYILSGPALIAAFSALLCGRLMSFVGKKILVLIFFGIFMIGGIAGDFVHNAYYMSAMRTLVGIAAGAQGVLALAIISDVFIDEKTRSSAVGVYHSLQAVMGSALGWVSGMVAMAGWRLVFRIYLVSIPILLLLILFVPNDKARSIEVGGKAGNHSLEKIPWLKLMLLSGAYFVYSSIYCIVYYQISMVITDKAIGDVSFIGLCSALGTAGGFVSSLFFGVYYNRLKRFTPFIGFAGLLSGFLMLYFGSTPLIAIIAIALLGSMYGLGLSYYKTYCTVIVPKSQVPMAISITMTIATIGTFLSTYISLLFQRLLGTSITGIIPVLAIILAVGMILSFFTALGSRKIAAPLAVSDSE